MIPFKNHNISWSIHSDSGRVKLDVPLMQNVPFLFWSVSLCEWLREVTCVCYTAANKASLALIDSLCDYCSALWCWLMSVSSSFWIMFKQLGKYSTNYLHYRPLQKDHCRIFLKKYYYYSLFTVLTSNTVAKRFNTSTKAKTDFFLLTDNWCNRH